MGPSAGELVESKHNSKKIIEKKYAAHLFNGISASKVNIKIRCEHFTLSQDMHLQEDSQECICHGWGLVYCFPVVWNIFHSRPVPLPFNFIINESTDIHQGHVGSKGG